MRPRLTRRSAGRLLDDPNAVPGDPLAGVLRAASAAPGGEAPGEGLAVARFQARPGPVTNIGGTSLMTRTYRKLLAAPAAGLAAAGIVLAGGGIAVAASQGALHVPFTGHDHRSSHAPAAPASTNPGVGASHAPASPGAEPTDLPSGTPSPSLDGLCRAFQAGAVHNGADNPAFAALTTAAGGADKVTAYCLDRVGPSAKPAHPTHPAKPTQAATPTHPTPTHPAKPTQAATPTHPTPSRPALPTQAATPTHRAPTH